MSFMRGVVQFVGWAWVVFNGLAALYGLLTQGDVGKGVIVAMTCLIIASPGVLLILWERRASQTRHTE